MDTPEPDSNLEALSTAALHARLALTDWEHDTEFIRHEQVFRLFRRANDSGDRARAGQLLAALSRRLLGLSKGFAVQDAMEAVMVGFDRASDGGPAWQAVRQQFRGRGFDLPMRLISEESPFYLLQAAYSAKLGRPVACRLPNLIGLANNLFQRHKSTLWVFSVLMHHYQRGAIFRANGDIARWRKRRDEYRRGWREGAPEFAPDRQFDRLLAFLFPGAAPALARPPAEAERVRLSRRAG